MNMMTQNKVAIHCRGWVTREGRVCRNRPQYHVIVGQTPVGPRGGRCGTYVAGRDAAGYRFRSRVEAEEWARKFAEASGFEFIG